MNHLLRHVPPSLIEDSAQRHDNFVLDTLRQLLDATELDEKTQAQAKFPFLATNLISPWTYEATSPYPPSKTLTEGVGDLIFQ